MFVYTSLSTFVKSDLEILQRYFDVKPIQWTRTGDLKNVLRILWYIYQTDLTFVWFAGGHAVRIIFFSKLFGKKSIVVVGGYEVANVPEISYGLMVSPKSARKVIFALKNANKLLVVSKFTKNETLEHTNSENVKVVYNGVNCDKFKPQGKKEDLVITVFAGDNWDTVRLKGIDTFVESAKFLLDIKFIVVGTQGDALKKLQNISPPNVVFINPLPQDELIPYYQKAKVYCQLSYRESFGLSLAEAMACGCIPVVTNRGAIPEVVGDTGFYVPYGDAKMTAKTIKEALQSDKGRAARERIKRMFPIERREKELVSEIEDVMNN